MVPQLLCIFKKEYFVPRVPSVVLQDRKFMRRHHKRYATTSHTYDVICGVKSTMVTFCKLYIIVFIVQSNNYIDLDCVICVHK